MGNNRPIHRCTFSAPSCVAEMRASASFQWSAARGNAAGMRKEPDVAACARPVGAGTRRERRRRFVALALVVLHP